MTYPIRKDAMIKEPDLTKEPDLVLSRLGELDRQLAGYRQDVTTLLKRKPRRYPVAPWIAVACAWLAAGTLSVFAVLVLGPETASTDDGKIAWVVFVSFGTALTATLFAGVYAATRSD